MLRLVLPPPPDRYDATYMAQALDQIARAVENAWNRGEDIVISGSRSRLILVAPDGSKWSLVVDSAGLLGTEAL
jgi:hypothetical protein